jgi:hypothetical protein
LKDGNAPNDQREHKLIVRGLADNVNISNSVEAKIRFETVDRIIVLLDALGIKGVGRLEILRGSLKAGNYCMKNIRRKLNP